MTARKPVGRGKTGAEKLTLELGGVRAQAVFHVIDDERGSPREPVKLADGTKVMYFRDSYKSQVAAYQLSRIMGMSNVPPSVKRTIDGAEGSLQLWIQGATGLTDWRTEHGGEPQIPYLRQQIHDMRVWDNLVNNTDRNAENIMWTPDWNLWMIDHTRSLSRDTNLINPNYIQKCSRTLWQSLQALDEGAAKAQLGPYLSSFEIAAIFKRRKRMIKIIEDRIRKLGESKVLFNLSTGVTISSSPAESST